MATARFQDALARLEALEVGADEARSKIHQELALLAEEDPTTAKRVLSQVGLEQLGERLIYVDFVQALALESTSLFPFLVDELERIRLLVPSLSRQAALGALFAFEFLEQNEVYRGSALDLHLGGLSSDCVWVRLASIKALHGWKVADVPGALGFLNELLRDRSWQVRAEAEWLLEDEGFLPPGYRTSIPDKLVRSFARGSRGWSVGIVVAFFLLYLGVLQCSAAAT